MGRHPVIGSRRDGPHRPGQQPTMPCDVCDTPWGYCNPGCTLAKRIKGLCATCAIRARRQRDTVPDLEPEEPTARRPGDPTPFDIAARCQVARNLKPRPPAGAQYYRLLTHRVTA